MEVAEACKILEEKFLKTQQTASSDSGKPRELRTAKSNKIPRSLVEPSTKHQPSGGQAGALALQAQQSQQTPDAGQLDFLEGRLQALLVECRPSDADAMRIESCLREMRGVIGSIGPEWSLQIFGSLASHFNTSASDVDATCVKAGQPREPWEAQAAARFLREQLAPLLRKHPRLTVIEEVFSAKVPIIRLGFDGLLDVDLSCQNLHALRNTRYLRTYADMDPRVRDLGIAVKLWAKAVGVCGAAKGHLSSYTFTLMVIYFMQVHVHVHLPCLPTKAFEAGGAGENDSKVAELQGSWTCGLSLAELLARFFWFYHREFMWGQEVVSPRLGRRLFAPERPFQQLRGRWAARLHVEDPFRLERNLHHVLGDSEEARLREALEKALCAILTGGVPAGLQSVGRPAATGTPLGFSTGVQSTPRAQEPLPAAAAVGERIAASPRCSSVSSTTVGEADVKDWASPKGSISHELSQQSDEEPDLGAAAGAGEEPLARWQRRQLRRPRSGQADAPAAGSHEGAREVGGRSPEEGEDEQLQEGDVDGQYEWWHSLGSAGAAREASPPARHQEGGRPPSESYYGTTPRESYRQRWVWRRTEHFPNDAKEVGLSESAPEPVASSTTPETRQPVCLTVQDLEDKMGQAPGANTSYRGIQPGTAPALGQATRAFAAHSTNKIASRVSEACLSRNG